MGLLSARDTRFEAAVIGMGFTTIEAGFYTRQHEEPGMVRPHPPQTYSLHEPEGFKAFVSRALERLPRGIFVVAPVPHSLLGHIIEEQMAGVIPDDNLLGTEDGVKRHARHDAYTAVIGRAELEGQPDSLVVAVNDGSQVEIARMSGAYVVGLSEEPGGNMLTSQQGIRCPNQIVANLDALVRIL